MDSIEHHLNYALVVRGEIILTPPAGSAIERTLETRIDTALSPKLRAREKVLHSGGNLKSRVKWIVKRKLASRSKRPPTDGWRLNGTEFNQLHSFFTNSLWKVVVTLLV
jgi:hypothetical protein